MYKKWLDDRMRLNLIRATLALVKKVQGTTDQVASIASAQRTVNAAAPDGTPYAKLPEAASIFTASQGVEYQLLSPNLQASDVKEDGRNILLAVSAGAGLPEYMVTSDASNANYASTMVAEAPGVREFMDWQDFFGLCFQEICTKALMAGIKAGEVPTHEEVEIKLRVTDPETMEAHEESFRAQQEVSTDVTVTFPELVHRDIEKETKSYVQQVMQGWMSNRTASTRLDLDYDYEREQIDIEEERGEGDSGSGEEDEDYIRARAAALQAEAPEGEEGPET
jgi:hypothetical protein